jgi:hypothetical protein
MEKKPCIICGKSAIVRGKEYFCLDCFDLYQRWAKFRQIRKDVSAYKEKIEQMSLFRLKFLLRLFLFAFVGGVVFELSCLFHLWVAVNLLVVFLVSVFIVLPLVFKGTNPLDRKRAEIFFWPFIITTLFLGILKDFEMFKKIHSIIFYLIAFCCGFLWVYLNDRKLKIKAAKSLDYYLKMSTNDNVPVLK